MDSRIGTIRTSVLLIQGQHVQNICGVKYQGLIMKHQIASDGRSGDFLQSTIRNRCRILIGKQVEWACLEFRRSIKAVVRFQDVPSWMATLACGICKNTLGICKNTLIILHKLSAHLRPRNWPNTTTSCHLKKNLSLWLLNASSY